MEIGETVARSLEVFFSLQFNIEEIERLEELGVQMEVKGEFVGDALLGKQFVVTGSLESLTRDEAKKNFGIGWPRYFQCIKKNRLRCSRFRSRF